MRRRDFLKVVGLSGAVVGSGAGLIVATTPQETPKELPFELPTEMVTHPLYEPPVRASVKLEDAVLVPESQSFDHDFVETDWSKMLDEHLERYDVDFSNPSIGKCKGTDLYTAFLIPDKDRINHTYGYITAVHVTPALMSLAKLMKEESLYPSSQQLYVHQKCRIHWGLLCHVSEGGQVPLRCCMQYDARRRGTLVSFDTPVLEA